MNPFDGLTELELQIVREVGLGLTSREIAEKLKISEGEVQRLLYISICGKTGVSNRVELILFAEKHKLI